MSNKEIFKKMSLDNIMSDRFGRYSKYIIQDRAIPDVRDGLKPVQRRILYAMSELGLLHNRSFKKSARVVGEVIGKYHPHGDSSIYEAMVRMSQSWKMRERLIEMHGNNGSIDDDPAAAMRYTEARLSKISEVLLKDINKNTVRFAPNFDDSEVEPIVLPALFPNLLSNGARGIAAGYATEMPPHNLGEIIDATIARIKSPNCVFDTLLKFVKGPDFPTGGIIFGDSGILDAFQTGRGRIALSSKYEINTTKTNPSITITELPFGVVKSKLVRDIAEISHANKIPGIKDVIDESDRHGISILIKITPGMDTENILNYLLKRTEMQVYYNYNNIAIHDRAPKLLNLADLIDAFIAHQKEVLTASSKYDLKKAKNRLEILKGLIKAADNIDAIIKLIRNTKGSKAAVSEALVKKFKFTKVQADAIADLRLYRLSATDQEELNAEVESLKKFIKKLNSILDDGKVLSAAIIEQLESIKKDFATERKTEIRSETRKLEVNREALVKEEPTIVCVSKNGYIKRFSNRVKEANEISTFALRENDVLVSATDCLTTDKLLIFTSKGRYSFIPIYKIEESQWKQIGIHLNDFTNLTEGEYIVSTTAVNDFNINLFVSSVSAMGKVKRTKIADFVVSRYTKPLVFMKLAANDYIVNTTLTNGALDFIVGTQKGYVVRYKESTIGETSPKSGGVRGIKLSKDDLVSFFAASKSEDILGLISSKGYAKRVEVKTILPMSRSTKGKGLWALTPKNKDYPVFAASVSTETLINYPAQNSVPYIMKFADVSISTTKSQFTKLKSSGKGIGQILITKNYVSKESPLLAEQNKDKIFSDAENRLSDAQLSIDDILKDIDKE